jgi:hypothetical protein
MKGKYINSEVGSASILSWHLRILTRATFVLVLLFVAFSKISTNVPALVSVNPFADGPFNSIGSFGFQIAVFSLLFSVLRLIRPYKNPLILANQSPFILRGLGLALFAVTVTLISDAIALARFPQVWMSSPMGKVLALSVFGLIFLSTLTGFSLTIVAPLIRSSNRTVPQTRATTFAILSIFIIVGLILAFYPEKWNQSVAGTIVSDIAGMLILMLLLAVLRPLLSYSHMHHEDILDDVSAVWNSFTLFLHRKSARFTPLLDRIRTFLKSKYVLKFKKFFNPRKHSLRFLWLFSVKVIVAFSVLLIAGRSLNPNVYFKILGTSIYFAIEILGLLIAFILFGKFLGIFRDEK